MVSDADVVMTLRSELAVLGQTVRRNQSLGADDALLLIAAIEITLDTIEKQKAVMVKCERLIDRLVDEYVD